MKKIVTVVFLIVAVVGAIVATIVAMPKNVYAKDICILTQKIVLKEGDEYTLSNKNFNVLPSQYSQKVVYSCNDQNVAQIDVFDGVIKAIQKGHCDVFIFVKKSKTEVINKKIAVDVVEQSISPQEVYVDLQDLQLYVGQNQKLTFDVDKTSNFFDWYCKNDCVVYDATTSTVTATKVGEDLLVISFKQNDGKMQYFNTVVNINPKDIFKQNITYDMSVQNYLYLQYQTSSGKDECNIYIVQNDNVIQIVEKEYKHFCIVASKIGEATVVVETPTSINYFYVNVVQTEK